MSVVKCEKCGQHYDDEKFRICPNCGILQTDMDRTVYLPDGDATVRENSYDKTVSLEDDLSETVRETVYTNGNLGRTIADDITVSEFSSTSGIKPVVGWLVCTEGLSKGADYRLQRGWNRIGRAPEMQVRIKNDDTVSRKHGAVVYDDRANRYFAVNETGALVYLNGESVKDSEELNTGDVLEIGNCKFIFIAYCTEERKW